MSIDAIASLEHLQIINSLCPFRPADALKTSQNLRDDGYDANVVAELLTQAEIHTRATAKFSASQISTMLFTRDGYEQATRASIAAFHAHRFVEAGATHVIDFGCSIGADSLAFLEAGLRVTAIELNPEAAAAARWNMRTHITQGTATVIEADGFSLDLHKFGADAIWLDPARRKNGKRLNNPDDWIPSLPDAIFLASQFSAAGMKVAPGIDYEWLPERSSTEWISSDGDLLEAVMWLGTAAPKPGRAAVIIHSSHTCSPLSHDSIKAKLHSDALSSPELGELGTLSILPRDTFSSTNAQISCASPEKPNRNVTSATVSHATSSTADTEREMLDIHWDAGVCDPSEPPEYLEPAELGRYLIEPDPAIIRSGSIASFARAYGLAPVSSGIAYLTGSQIPPDTLASTFEVIDVLPIHAKKVGVYLREHEITSVEIKKRGTDISPEHFRKQLKLKGSGSSATLILTPINGQHRALVCRRVR